MQRGPDGEPGEFFTLPVDDNRIRQRLLGDNEYEKLLGLAEMDFGYREPIPDWLVRVFGRKNLQPADATAIWNEVAYSVYCTAITNPKAIKETGELTPYLRTIAVNKAIDFFRARSRSQLVTVRNIETLTATYDEVFDDEEPPPSESELRTLIKEGIQLLNDSDQPVLSLHYSIGERGHPPSLEELTKAFNNGNADDEEISTAAIKGRLQRGRAALRAFLQDRGIDI